MIDEGFKRVWRIFLRKSRFTTNESMHLYLGKIEIKLIKLGQFILNLVPGCASFENQ